MQKKAKAPEFIKEFLKCRFGGKSCKALNEMLQRMDFGYLTGELNNMGILNIIYSDIASGIVSLELTPENLSRWKTLSKDIALNNMLQEEECSSVFKELSSQGIKAALLKGIAYNAFLYGNRNIRKVNDLDILIKKQDYPAVRQLLESRSYKYYIQEKYKKYGDKYATMSEEDLGEVHFEKSSAFFNCNIDLHWDINNNFIDSPLYLLYPEVFGSWEKEYVGFKLGDTEICCLRLEQQFIHSVIHFALHHRFIGIKWFVDICHFIYVHGSSMDWELIDSLMSNQEYKKIMWLCLNMAADFGNIRLLPAEAAKRLDRYKCFRLLPYEYAFYRNRIFDRKLSWKYQLCKVLLPSRLMDKARVVAYYAFGSQSTYENKILKK